MTTVQLKTLDGDDYDPANAPPFVRLSKPEMSGSDFAKILLGQSLKVFYSVLAMS